MSTGQIIDRLRERGFDTVPLSYYAMIDTWKSWYEGKVRDFHNYRVYNGQQLVDCKRYSVGMAKKVCEDWANLLLNEKVAVTLEGRAEQDFFDRVCGDSNFSVKANEMQELKSALGTAAYILSADGVAVDGGTGAILGNAQRVKIDYLTADNIFPLEWSNGVITDCAFAVPKVAGGKNYLFLQIHHRNDGGQYVIENILYDNTNGVMKEIPLASVREYASVAPVIYTASDKPHFFIDRLNIANNVAVGLPMGVSVYANAIDQLKGVDIAYDSYVNEFVLGKKRIMVQPQTATRMGDGMPVFDPSDTVYYVLPEDISDKGTLISPIDPQLRTAEHNGGIQDMLNILSSKCGFGENHYRYDNGGITTATQIVSENSTLFRTLKKHEIILRAVLTDMARGILRLGNTYMGLGLNEDVEISVDFDDSIIEDKGTERQNDRQDLAAGIMNDYEYRMKWYNEDEATARAALPKMEDMSDEKQAEVE